MGSLAGSNFYHDLTGYYVFCNLLHRFVGYTKRSMSQRIVITGEAFATEAIGRLRDKGFEVERLPGDLTEGELIDRLQGAWGYIAAGAGR